MQYEFEGRTEQEAIDTAVEALGLEAHQFEVELLETHKSGLFGMNRTVRIRVHLPSEGPSPSEMAERVSSRSEASHVGSAGAPAPRPAPTRPPRATNAAPETDMEHAVVDFLTTLTEKMGVPADVVVQYREDNKVGLRFDSEHANMLIGRKGKNLDALQVLANVIASRIEDHGTKIVLDAEGYRGRREEQLIHLAQKVGDQVKRNGGSKLLEPMNPFERRLIHTTLADVADIGTESEGDGLYKQVRVFYRGSVR